MNRSRLSSLHLAVVLIILTAAKNSTQAKGLFWPDDIAIVSEGRALYQQNCASCHGGSLQGEPNWRRSKADLTMPAPPHDDTGHTWHHTDEVLFNLTKFGLAKYLKQPDYKSTTPACERILTDDEIKAVLSFIKRNWSAEMREHQDGLN